MNRREELQTLARYCVTKSPGFAAIALWVPYRDTDSDAYIAYTNGVEVVTGNGFWEFEPLERAFVLVHEILHVALRHCPRGSKIARRSAVHAYVWNLACDCIINHALSAMSWLQTPQKGVFFEKVLTPERLIERPPASWNAEELYLELLEQIGLPQNPDEMDAWLDAWLKERGLDGEGDLRIDESGEGDLSDEIASRVWASRLTRAQAADRAGGLLRQLARDFPVTQTPWPQILRAWLQDATMPRSSLNWNRPSRRTIALNSEIYEPATRRDRGIRRVAVVVDTSGSIDEAILTRFCAEIAQVQARTGCDLVLICADAAIQSEVIVKNDGKSFVDKVREGRLEFAGGGGTDFRPALERLGATGASVAIYLTDMMGAFGESAPKIPLLWCSTTPHQNAPFGRVIYLDPIHG